MRSAFSHRHILAAIGAVGAILPGVGSRARRGAKILLSSASSVCSDIAIAREGGAQRGERHLVGPHGSRKGVLAAAQHEIRRSDNAAGLRPAEQLVAAEEHEAGTRAECVDHARLTGPRARVYLDARPFSWARNRAARSFAAPP